jgi:hypothetical protein
VITIRLNFYADRSTNSMKQQKNTHETKKKEWMTCLNSHLRPFLIVCSEPSEVRAAELKPWKKMWKLGIVYSYGYAFKLNFFPFFKTFSYLCLSSTEQRHRDNSWFKNFVAYRQ